MASFWCIYYKLSTYFTPCFSVSIVNLEHIKAGSVRVRNSLGLQLISRECMYVFFFRFGLDIVLQNFSPIS